MDVMKVQGVTKTYGGVHAVSNVSFGVETGEHLVILGPNGAGKTTLFNMLTGQVKPTNGHLFFRGEDITNLPAHRRIHLGIGRSFQITSLFNGLNVMDNMLLAIQGTRAERYQMVRPLKRNRPLMDKAGELLDSFDLLELKHEVVSCISYGAQRKLEIALSMASDPKLLTRVHSSALSAAVNPLLGSSSKSSLGSEAMLRAISNLRCAP